MGRASSSKKVAKAARAGGNVKTSQGRKWGFPVVVGGVVLLGIVLIVFAATTRDTEDVSPRIGGLDHWHSAYGVYICGEFQPDQTDQLGDILGIHTHDDGLIHIHPTSANAAGENATFGVFAEEVGIDLGDGEFTLADGTTYANGDDCDGTEGEVRLVKWAAGDFEGQPELITSDFAGARFLGDGEAWVLVFAPADEEIPLPPNLVELANPSDLAPGEAPDIELPDSVTTSTIVPAAE